ncbi:TonB-dependent receptor [Caulobacter sp. BP25]|uniref:TonB-dependent receptor n=1 Tax=Caulobacter sp. BP25 TaxID=2048900 RepID=UPI000C12CD35|nr:TonB-dependent receptor [Caulobacter sp. BP25]PHY18123.1 TonB-dependent receptor [Caulobacter sp. BP25]
MTRVLLLASTAAASLLGFQALAQEVPSKATKDASTVEDLVVTATRRATRLQDADLSATVLDRETLDQARIRDIRQLDAAVANVQFNESGQLGSTFISIRGIESNPFIVNRAAVYIDGVPFRELSNAVLNQVESIEVLRGPQATLYGANSESGLIVINTRAPTAGFTGEARVTASAYKGGHELETDGFIAGPLAGDTLTGSLAFKLSDGDSFLRNLAADRRAGSIREAFVQGRLRWRPNDRLTVNGVAYVLDTRAPGVFDQEYLPMDTGLYNRSYAGAYNGGRAIGDFTYVNDAPKRTDEREGVAGASLNYRFDTGSLDAALSYRRLKVDARGLDLDFTALPTAAGQDHKDTDFINGEVRFSSPEDRPVTYMVGASIYRQDTHRFLATFVGSGGLDDYNPAPTQRAQAKDWGLFASVGWTPSAMPALTVNGGIRLDHAHRSARQLAGTLDLGLGGVLTYTEADLDADFKETLPRLGASYRVSPDLSVYANVAKGYIPGGFNLAAAQSNLGRDILRYPSETMWSREAGFKWRSADRRLRLSGAVFYIRSDNWQEIQVATNASGQIISSDYIGADASIDSKGFELEAVALPLPGLELTAGWGYADARYRDLQIDATTNLKGRRVKLTPAYDGYLAARYARPSGWYVRAEAALTGEETLEATGSAKQKATQVYGLQAGFETERYNARLFIENLTDVRRHSGMAFRNLGFGNDGNWYAPLARGRQAGLELTSRF